MNEHFDALGHLTGRTLEAPLDPEPYPHLILEGAFPEAYYDRMLERFPGPDEMVNPVRARRYTEIWEADMRPDPGMEHHADGYALMDRHFRSADRLRFWSGFREAFVERESLSGALIARFEAEGLLREKAGLVDAGYYTVARLAIDTLGAGLGPHVDRTDKLVSTIFSLAPHDVSTEDAEGSGTWLLKPKPDLSLDGVAHLTYDQFQHPAKSKMAAWLPNRMLAWAVTSDSFHAYHQRADIKRRTIKLFVQASRDPEETRREVAGTTAVAEKWRGTAA